MSKAQLPPNIPQGLFSPSSQIEAKDSSQPSDKLKLLAPPPIAVAPTTLITDHIQPQSCWAKFVNYLCGCCGVFVTDIEVIAQKLQPIAQALEPILQSAISIGAAEAQSVIAKEAANLGGGNAALISALQNIGSTMITGLTSAASNTTDGIVNANSIAQVKSALAGAAKTLEQASGNAANVAVTLGVSQAQQQLNDHISELSSNNPMIASTLKQMSATLLTGAQAATTGAINGLVSAQSVQVIQSILDTFAHTLATAAASSAAQGIDLASALAQAKAQSELGSTPIGQQTAGVIDPIIDKIASSASSDISGLAAGFRTSATSGAADSTILHPIDQVTTTGDQVHTVTG